MKTSNLNVFGSNKYSELTTVIRIKYKPLESELRTIDWRDIIGSYADILIDALERRCDAMIAGVCAAKAENRILSANADCIYYTRANTTVVTFTTKAYRNCEEAIDLLSNGHWDCICKEHWAQLAQAIVWIENPDNASTPEEKAKKDARWFRWSDCVETIINKITE